MYQVGNIRIEMLPAGAGDCILLDFIKEDYRILIDGGYADTYHCYLRKRLKKLAGLGKRINLLVISHIDSDHIGGILAFLKENGPAGHPEIIGVDEVWYNAFYHMKQEELQKGKLSYMQKEVLEGMVAAGSRRPEDGRADISVAQGETVAGLLAEGGYHWNTMWSGKAVSRENGEYRKLQGRIGLTLLNPGKNELRDLADYWIFQLRAKLRNPVICLDRLLDEAFESSMQNERGAVEVIRKDICLDTQESGKWDWEALANTWSGKTDESRTNCSSIAFLLEYEGIRMLFPGDCPVWLFGDKLPEELDIVKLPHHGSEKNIDGEFIGKKKVSCYLLSTDGKRHGHPSKAVIAAIWCKAPGKPRLLMNYRIRGLEGIGEFGGDTDE